MKRIYLVVSVIFMMTLCFGTTESILAEKHYVPGMGTYGVSNEKTTCSVCGTTYTRGEGHMCERPDRTTHHSSSSSSYADDQAAMGAISSDPNLLVNQTSYTPVDFSDYGNVQTPKKKSHTFRNIVIAVLVLGGLWWIRRFFKK